MSEEGALYLVVRGSVVAPPCEELAAMPLMVGRLGNPRERTKSL
jgi:hypothetical protein